MKTDRTHHWPSLLFYIFVALVLFSGFANMPLMKRYYISDIPGMAWSGNFFQNLLVHYAAGALVLAFSLYYATGYVLQRTRRRLTPSGTMRSLVLAMALASGVAIAIKNAVGAALPLEILMPLVLFHMGMAVLFMGLSLICAAAGCTWLTATDT